MKIDKEILKNTMLGLEQKRLEFSQDNYANYFKGAKMDRSDVIDDQSRSQAEQGGALAAAFDCAIHSHEETIKRLTSFNFAKQTIVQPGSVVKFNERNLVVSVATDAFTCQGEEFIGISEDAPIYLEMKGLSEGDTFFFNNQQFTIQLVY